MCPVESPHKSTMSVKKPDGPSGRKRSAGIPAGPEPLGRKVGAKLPRNLVGATVALMRREHHPPLTQDDLAGRMCARGCYLDQSAIAMIENGNRGVSDYELVALASSLRTMVAALLGPCAPTAMGVRVSKEKNR